LASPTPIKAIVLRIAFSSRRVLRSASNPLFDRHQRRAGHPGEGVNLLFDGPRLGCEVAMLQGVLVALGSAPTAQGRKALARGARRASRRAKRRRIDPTPTMSDVPRSLTRLIL
jgi:hypothetical protein